MSRSVTLPAEPGTAAASATAALVMLMLAHGLVDVFAASIQPLWPDLQETLGAGDGSIQWGFVAWSLATSFSQLLFGYWGDRSRGRGVIWAGPLVAVVGLSLLGFVGSLGTLIGLLVVGGLGIAAFHPEGAARAGACLPHDRSRAMSLFAVGGYLGQAVGPLYSGFLTARFGLRALLWGIAWGLPALAVLGLGLRRLDGTGQPRVGGREESRSVAGRVAPRTVALLLAIGTLRVVPAVGLPLTLAFLLKSRGATNEQVGMVQSIFLAAVGAGSLACAGLVRSAAEWRVLWLGPVLLAPVLMLVPGAAAGWLVVTVGAAGLILGVTMPVMVGYGQRLMPGAQRVASSITMGVSWGLGGVVVAATTAACNHVGRPELAGFAYAAASLAAGLLCFGLPGPGRKN